MSTTRKRAGRSRSTLPLATCPLCGTVHVEAIGRAGLEQQLTVFQCSVCERTWQELVSDQPQTDEEQLA